MEEWAKCKTRTELRAVLQICIVVRIGTSGERSKLCKSGVRRTPDRRIARAS
jgi:hypothetical protein